MPALPPHRRRPRCARAEHLALLLLVLGSACSSAGVGWQGMDPLRLRAYHEAFARDVGHQFDRTASADQFVRSAAAARVLWLGDDHRDRWLHVLQQALLRQLAARRPLCLLLEAIGEQDQASVDAYLAGRTSLAECAAAVRGRWPGSWLDDVGVDRDHYRALLAFARSTATPTLALEPTPRLPLERRDPTIAASVGRAVALHPDRLIVVIVGQTHLLGNGRLPARTGQPGLMLAAAPVGALLHATAPPTQPGAFVRSDGGLWFFADLLADAASALSAPSSRGAVAAAPARRVRRRGRPRPASGS